MTSSIGASSQVLDRGPFGDEGPIIRRRRLGGRLLQQDLGEPNPVGIGDLPRLRAPRERPAGAVPPGQRAGDNRLSLCLGRQRAYIGAHAIDLMPRFLTFCAQAMMKRARGGAKSLAEFTPGLVAEALAARGLGETSLIADWPAIVGENARASRPANRAAMAAPGRQTRSGRAGRWRDPGAEGGKRLRARGAAQRLGDRGSGERASRLAMRRQDRLPARPSASAQGEAPARASPLRRRRKPRRAPPPRRSSMTACATP